ncbi:MAG: hypothetical protein BroJett042_14830 [Bacteroidota bacterium]|nr:MAG: hypothetical protein BroJett042_14830 [Bacteroidota bacterium]
MSQQPQLIYADGSANRYEISIHELKYIPVKPEDSSTGMYSGGEPAQVVLSKEQYNHLKNLFETALTQTDQQIPDRIKTSGLVVVGEKKVNLKAGSALMLEVESTLQNLLKR